MSSNNKVLITNAISFDELHKRKVLFVFKEMMNKDFFTTLQTYTRETGHTWSFEPLDDFVYVGKKIEDDQYNTLCYECQSQLSIDVHIACIEKESTNEDRTLCQECWDDMRDEYKQDGWTNDCDSDDES
eukprot:SAG11_NODE_6777_length_1250_cov_89.510860_1_plen_129_part_00